VYFGLRKSLHAVVCNRLYCSHDLKVQISVDGVPLYKSSPMQFWPILCSVNNSSPILVALFLGTTKPNSAEAFLDDFCKEFDQLSKDGFVCVECARNVNLPVTLHAVVCDAPARAFLKNRKGHNSLHACERCEAVAVSMNNRTIFSSESCFKADKRCSDVFSDGGYYGTHQNDPTPLTTMSNDCINTSVH